MPVELPYSFQNLDVSGLPNAVDSDNDIIGKAVPASYLDSNFQVLARITNAGSIAPSNPYAGMLWYDTSTGVLKVYDGSQWISNIDRVDGFHASQTPTANTIPVADSSGKIASGWLNASQTPTANTIPIADSSGKLASGWLPTIATSGNAVFTSSGSWTVPSGVTSILILAVGGGGGGGGARAEGDPTIIAAGAGGYCGTIIYTKKNVSPEEQLTITIGSGGSGGSGSSNGGSGGTTSVIGSVSGTLVSCSGGGGGGAGNNFISTSGRAGCGLRVSTSGFAKGGDGGGGIGEGGSGAYYGNGQSGRGYGCGGGGGATVLNVSGTTTATGGNGTAGIVVIWY